MSKEASLFDLNLTQRNVTNKDLTALFRKVTFLTRIYVFLSFLLYKTDVLIKEKHVSGTRAVPKHT